MTDNVTMSGEDQALGGSAFADLVDQMRTMLDRFVQCAPAPDEIDCAKQRVQELTDLFEGAAAPAGAAWAGLRTDLPARGHVGRVPWSMESQDESRIAATVTFRPLHAGMNQVTHGGALALLLDEVMGRLANLSSPTIARTSDLHLRYERVTPVGLPLQIQAQVRRVLGRRSLISARLSLPSGERTVQAYGMFVTLRPEQI